MTPQALLAKIETLPPEKRAEVEDLVDSLTRPSMPSLEHNSAAPDDLILRIREHREQLRHRYGQLDSLPILRDLRENGPR